MKHNWKVSLIFAALLTLFASYPAYSVKYDKSNPTKMYSKAYKMIDKGQFSKAQKILKNYTKSEPDDSDGWTLLAFSYRKLEKFEASEESYFNLILKTYDELFQNRLLDCGGNVSFDAILNNNTIPCLLYTSPSPRDDL